MRGSGSKWNRSDSSDSDSGQPMTPLTIAILDFHFVKGALSTATMTKTPSPVITSLLQKVMGFVKPEGEGGGGGRVGVSQKLTPVFVVLREIYRCQKFE